ncbi:MAG: glycosyltransferase family 2 protein [Candidatus Levybacteria bacterium]|nr:glycosyltransferase family 2 protein [Candidatus Levybacteria bacterium]
MISIIIPFFNEEENLLVLYKEIIKYIPQLDKEYEIIFVDDGSNDGSLLVAKEIAQKNNKVRLFSFRINYGKAEALMFGFKKAKGNYIVTLDADLQDKPSEIEKLLKKAKEGWDLVCGWRKDRKDSLLKVFSSKVFNMLAGKLWGMDIHDHNCGLKVYSREAVKSLNLYGGLHRFIPVLLHKQGFLISEELISHDVRKFGKSKFGVSKLWKDLPDIFTMIFLIRYKDRPFHLFGTVGGIFILCGMLILSYLSIIWLGGQSIGRRPLLFFGMLLVLSGFQIFFTGFLADLMINVSNQIQRKNGQEKEDFLLKYSSDSI